jgi:hypothetical protein
MQLFASFLLVSAPREPRYLRLRLSNNDCIKNEQLHSYQLSLIIGFHDDMTAASSLRQLESICIFDFFSIKLMVKHLTTS